MSAPKYIRVAGVLYRRREKADPPKFIRYAGRLYRLGDYAAVRQNTLASIDSAIEKLIELLKSSDFNAEFAYDTETVKSVKEAAYELYTLKKRVEDHSVESYSWDDAQDKLLDVFDLYKALPGLSVIFEGLREDLLKLDGYVTSLQKTQPQKSRASVEHSAAWPLLKKKPKPDYSELTDAFTGIATVIGEQLSKARRIMSPDDRDAPTTTRDIDKAAFADLELTLNSAQSDMVHAYSYLINEKDPTPIDIEGKLKAAWKSMDDARRSVTRLSESD